MSQEMIPPRWAKLFKVTEVSRWDADTDTNRAWHQYVLESEYSRMVGKRFGTSSEVREHANARVDKLNERLLGGRSDKVQSKKKK